jgi:hypothetical protein
LLAGLCGGLLGGRRPGAFRRVHHVPALREQRVTKQQVFSPLVRVEQRMWRRRKEERTHVMDDGVHKTLMRSDAAESDGHADVHGKLEELQREGGGMSPRTQHRPLNMSRERRLASRALRGGLGGI